MGADFPGEGFVRDGLLWGTETLRASGAEPLVAKVAFKDDDNKGVDCFNAPKDSPTVAAPALDILHSAVLIMW